MHNLEQKLYFMFIRIYRMSITKRPYSKVFYRRNYCSESFEISWTFLQIIHAESGICFSGKKWS